jgi:hypothetical protein
MDQNYSMIVAKQGQSKMQAPLIYLTASIFESGPMPTPCKIFKHIGC